MSVPGKLVFNGRSAPELFNVILRLHYDKNNFTSQIWAQIWRSRHQRCWFCWWLGHFGGLHGGNCWEVLQILWEEAAKVELHINLKKTKTLAIDPSSPAVNSPVSLDSTTGIEVVQEFTYLGSILSSDGSLLPKLQARLFKASSAMGRLNRHLWRKPNISRTTKLWVFNTLVGAKTWQASAATLKEIEIFYSKSLRGIKVPRWSDVVSNEKLLQLTKYSRFSIQAAERTLRWSGHLLRMPPHLPAKTIYDFNPIKAGWKQPRARPKKRWADSVSGFLTMANIRSGEEQILAMDQSGWRRPDVTLYAKQLLAGDINQSKSSFLLIILAR